MKLKTIFKQIARLPSLASIIAHFIQRALKKTANSTFFRNLILVAIVLATIIVSLEAYPEVASQYSSLLQFCDRLILTLFIAECFIKIAAEVPYPWRYFTNIWNIFDFLIVIALMLATNSQYLVLLRMARLLQVFKLVTAFPALQIIISALVKSIPSMGCVLLILSLLFYGYGVAATFLFGQNDPVHFNSLSISILSLFRVITLEDWTDIMYIQMFGCDKYGYEGIEELCTQPFAFPFVSPVFFVSFVVLGAMIIINLFVSIITTHLMKSLEQNQPQS